MDWLNEPVKVWHLILLAVAFGITLQNMEKKLNSIGKSVSDVWDKFHPVKDDD